MRSSTTLLALALLLPGCLVPDSLVRASVDRDGDGEVALGYVGALGVGTDCDDLDPLVGTTQDEVCGDDIDNDCDGVVDGLSDQGEVWYVDHDGDGFAGSNTSVRACRALDERYHKASLDCDDADGKVYPGADETCNDADDDCDLEIDEELPVSTYYADGDGDGYGDPEVTLASCGPVEGYTSMDGDCDDGDGTVNPTGTEVWYDGVDQDCSGGSDYDADGDGFETVDAWPSGVPDGVSVDCDDSTADVYPGAEEVWYDGIDQDCNPATEWDYDGDGYAVDHVGYQGIVDCDDRDVLVNEPGDWYLDDDGDGYGVSGAMVQSCGMPAGYAALAGDCDDGDEDVRPGVPDDDCDGVDDNCSGTADEDGGEPAWPDMDEDGFGAPGAHTMMCEVPTGWSRSPLDCDDDDPGVNPSIQENHPTQCDGKDNDCDSETEADGPGVCEDALAIRVGDSLYLTPDDLYADDFWGAYDWCFDRGYHLWRLEDGDDLESAGVFGGFEFNHAEFDAPAEGTQFRLGACNRCPGASSSELSYLQWYADAGSCEFIEPDGFFVVSYSDARSLVAEVRHLGVATNGVTIVATDWDTVSQAQNVRFICESEL